MIARSSSHAFLVLVCVTLLTPSTALYTKKGPVNQLTTKTFSQAVLDSNLPAVVEFYAPWYVRLDCTFPEKSQRLTYRDKLLAQCPCCDCRRLPCRCGHCKALAPHFTRVAENLQVHISTSCLWQSCTVTAHCASTVSLNLHSPWPMTCKLQAKFT